MESRDSIQRDGTELMTIFTVSEIATAGSTDPNGGRSVYVRTNLATVARWRMRDGMGVFMLGPVASNETKRVGVILSAAIMRPKK